MLKVLKMDASFAIDDNGESLFKRNPNIMLKVEAPLYWWLEQEFETYNFCMPTSDFRYCLDAWRESVPYIQNMQLSMRKGGYSPRQLMQILPLSTLVVADIHITYQQIVEVCENYDFGEFDYTEEWNQWDIQREWSDFCETLMDIRGVRELIEKEGINNGN